MPFQGHVTNHPHLLERFKTLLATSSTNCTTSANSGRVNHARLGSCDKPSTWVSSSLNLVRHLQWEIAHWALSMPFEGLSDRTAAHKMANSILPISSLAHDMRTLGTCAAMSLKRHLDAPTTSLPTYAHHMAKHVLCQGHSLPNGRLVHNKVASIKLHLNANRLSRPWGRPCPSTIRSCKCWVRNRMRTAKLHLNASRRS